MCTCLGRPGWHDHGASLWGGLPRDRTAGPHAERVSNVARRPAAACARVGTVPSIVARARDDMHRALIDSGALALRSGAVTTADRASVASSEDL